MGQPNKKKRKWQSKLHPCVIFELQPYNPEHAHGYRFRVHDIDDDQWYFVEKERMYDMLTIHSFHPILPAEMEELRKEKAAKGK